MYRLARNGKKRNTFIFMRLLCCGSKAASAVGPEGIAGLATAVREEYPMWVMPMSAFVELDKLLPHQLLKETGKVVQFDTSMVTVFFLSHQCVVRRPQLPERTPLNVLGARLALHVLHRWTGFCHPDATLEQLRTMQRLFLRMMAGDVKDAEPDFESQAYLPNTTKVTKREWAAMVPNAYIWLDYFSVPQIGEYLQGDTSDLVRAVNSIPSYVERSSHFFACVPSTRHNDRVGVTCDFGSWLSRGWCRLEMFSLLFMRFNSLPVIVVKGSECAPYMIAPHKTMARPPGKGEFTCCMRNHKMTDTDGTERGIPCDKIKIGELLWTMLKSKLAFLLGDNQIIEYRLWLGLVPHFMFGLPANDDALKASRSATLDAHEGEDAVKDFLAVYRFKTAMDEEERGGSGQTPLMHAAMVGNVAVAIELIAQGADVHCTTRIFNRTTGMEPGMTALHVAVAICPARQVEMVTVLLRVGADANAPSKSGVPPLMGGVSFHSILGVKALLECAAGTLDLERSLVNNGETALGLAAFNGTPELCELLVRAGASRSHVTTMGGTLVHAACQNIATTRSMLDLIWNEGELNINVLYKPRTAFWRLVLAYFQRGVKHGLITKSQFAMEMAHSEGSTPLHFSAMTGLIDVTVWLLDHGAHKSLSVRNAMGSTPLDVARIFGPYPVIETKIGAAMLNHNFYAQFAIRRGSLLRRQAVGSIVEPEATGASQADKNRPVEATSQPDAHAAGASGPVNDDQSSSARGDESGDKNSTTAAGSTHTAQTTAAGGGAARFRFAMGSDSLATDDIGTALTALSSGLDARFDEQNARFDEQTARFGDQAARFDEQVAHFDEQAARLDRVDARFDSLQADNTRLQAQLHVQNAKLDALLSATHAPAVASPAAISE